MLIDIGGTPSNILGRNKYDVAAAEGISLKKLIVILDPFDLSRSERRLELGDYKIKAIKFSIEVPGGQTNLTSEKVVPPTMEYCQNQLNKIEGIVLGKIQSEYGKYINMKKIKDRFSVFRKRVEGLAENSINLREFMEGLVKLLVPRLSFVKLEEVLSKNSKIVFDILNKLDVPARTICNNCNRFIDISLRKKELECPFCNAKLFCKDIIDSGKYIPQKSFLPVITYLCGYLTYSNSQEKIEQVRRIMKVIQKNGEPIKTYQEPKIKMTMFESFIFDGQKETFTLKCNSIKYKNGDRLR